MLTSEPCMVSMSPTVQGLGAWKHPAQGLRGGDKSKLGPPATVADQDKRNPQGPIPIESGHGSRQKGNTGAFSAPLTITAKSTQVSDLGFRLRGFSCLFAKGTPWHAT